MTPGSREILAIAAGSSVLASALGGVSGYLIRRRRETAGTRKDEAEALAADNLTNERLFHDNSKLRILVRAYESAAQLRDRQIDNLREENDDLKHLVPKLTLVAETMDLDRICSLYDEASDGWVLTSNENDGTFTWANRAFCEALHLTLDEVRAAHWKDLVLPEFLVATAQVESAAWGRPVQSFKNAFHRKGGGTVWLDWFSCPYRDGSTISIVPRMRIEA